MSPPSKNAEGDSFIELREKFKSLQDSFLMFVEETHESIKDLYNIVRSVERGSDASLAEIRNIDRRLDGHHEKIENSSKKIDLLLEKGSMRSQMNEQAIQQLKEVCSRLVILQERLSEKTENINASHLKSMGAQSFMISIFVTVFVSIIMVILKAYLV